MDERTNGRPLKIYSIEEIFSHYPTNNKNKKFKRVHTNSGYGRPAYLESYQQKFIMNRKNNNNDGNSYVRNWRSTTRYVYCWDDKRRNKEPKNIMFIIPGTHK
jgi:hypothetical protein